MDILLLGSGGREHAIAVALKASPLCDALYVAPGNGGTAAIATNIKLDINDPAAVADYAAEHGVGLVVIGPEAPLVAGVADAVRAKGIPAFGPGAQGAQMEGSKRFAKEFMERHGIPTAAYRSFTEQAGAEVVGACCAIEKGFQKGGDSLRADGIRVESLAIIDSMSDDSVTFRR